MFVATTLPLATCLLELAPLTTNIWACVGVLVAWRSAEVLNSLASSAPATQQDGALTQRRHQCQLVERYALTTSLER